MTKKWPGNVIVLLACVSAVSALCISDAGGQTRSRSAITLTNPGTLSTIGKGTSGYTLRYNSFGLGSLHSGGQGGNVLHSGIGATRFSLSPATGAYGTSALRSGISAGGAYRIPGATAHRAIPGAPAAGLGLPSGTLIYTPKATRLYMPPKAPAGTASLKSPEFMAAEKYVASLGQPNSTSLTDQSKPITSLVPEQEGLYKTYLAEGEKAFRLGDFRKAFQQFELAGYIAPQAPEVLLSMAHARFAQTYYSYSSAAQYLRKALKVLPELPLAPLQPKAFYEVPTTYMSHVDRLEAAVRIAPRDPDANLFLAYLRWFEGDTQAARKALLSAHLGAAQQNNQEAAEAVDIFWAGMVASGKVSGKLAPASTTAPAAKSPPAATAATQAAATARE